VLDDLQTSAGVVLVVMGDKDVRGSEVEALSLLQNKAGVRWIHKNAGGIGSFDQVLSE